MHEIPRAAIGRARVPVLSARPHANFAFPSSRLGTKLRDEALLRVLVFAKRIFADKCVPKRELGNERPEGARIEPV